MDGMRTTYSPSRESRWIILTEDGHHVTIGRYTDPSEAEIVRAEERLLDVGLGGWLAVLQGSYYVETPPQLVIARVLGKPMATWDDAAAAFERHRLAVVAR
jgi:hypothetical protein